MRQQIVFKLHSDVELPQDLIDGVPMSGRADDSVSDLRDAYDIQCDPTELRIFLKSYGAWSEQDLADHEANLDRLVWLACLDCQEQETTYFYMGA